MPYRPTAEHRRNIRGVVLPLTAAIHRVFGSRAQDGARPIGAFYTDHVDDRVWVHVGGIWYRPVDEESVSERSVNEAVVRAFSESLGNGQRVDLPSGAVVEWEAIPAQLAQQLPPPLA